MRTNRIDSDSVNRFISKLEESSRATRGNTASFIEPALGTLAKAENLRTHLIFGRRGSGKSSLLNKVSSQLSLQRRPNVMIDMETFKGHSYPDVLISILINVFQDFTKWLNEQGTSSSTKSLWIKFFGKRPTGKPLNRVQVADLTKRIEENIAGLKSLLHTADESETVAKSRHEATSDASVNIGFGAPQIAGATLGFSDKHGVKAGRESESHYKFKKIEKITQSILEYQKIFRDMKVISNGDAFLLLDDLYYIRKEDQHHIIDFFHRIAKQNGLILKIGTIRHRSQWYLHGNPPIGLKIGDDCDDINLDLSLEHFESTKKFLSTILDAIVEESLGVRLRDIVTDGCIERLCLASGGVARDFIGIFKKAAELARGEIKKRKAFMIGTEDINEASGDYDTNKREELKLDTFEDRTFLEDLFEEVCEFCLNTVNCNIFLLPKDATESKFKKIQELVDLRLIHFVDARVTLRTKPGKIFEAYLLDLSQYSGSRKRRNFKIIEFWKQSGKAELRDARLLLP